MKQKIVYTTVFLVLVQFVAFSQTVPQIQKTQKTRILFIFDASYSMQGIWNNRTKMEAAKSVFIPFLDSVSKLPNVELALRVYGNRSPFPPQDCGDTHLEVPFGANNANNMLQIIQNVKPNGTTPIANSLLAAAKDFPKDTTARNIIFLITDGIESCDGDPCAISRELQAKGVFLRPFIIGVGTDIDFNKVFDCAGQVYSATNEVDFLPILHIAMQKAVTTTPLQVYLLDIYKKPLETDVPITFYDLTSGYMKYNFMHSVIKPGEPDILFVDPLITYQIKVHTKPPVYSDTIRLEAGKHTIARIDVPQGFLEIQRPMGMPISVPMTTIVRKSGEMNTLHMQHPREKVKYLIGTYDLEVLTLPRTYVYDVQIKPDETTLVPIEQPGRLSISRTMPGHGSIFIDRNTDLEFVVALDDIPRNNDSFILQPGKYVFVWRSKKETDTEKTYTESFIITPGSSKFIQIK